MRKIFLALTAIILTLNCTASAQENTTPAFQQYVTTYLPEGVIGEKLQETIDSDLVALQQKHANLFNGTAIYVKPPFYTVYTGYNDGNTSMMTVSTYWVKGKTVKLIEEYETESSGVFQSGNGQPMPASSIQEKTIDDVYYKVKDSSKENKDSVLIKGNFDLECGKLLHSDYVSIFFCGYEWIMPLNDFRTSKPTDNGTGKTITVKSSSSKMIAKYDNCEARFNFTDGSFQIKATGLELDGKTDEDYKTEIYFSDQAIASMTGITGDVPLSLLKGNADYLDLKSVKYRKSPYKTAAKRAIITGIFTSKNIAEASDTNSIGIKLGSLSDTVWMQNFDQKGNSGKYTYQTNLAYNLTALDLVGNKPFELYISKADIDFDKGQFKITADLFLGDNSPDTIAALNSEDLSVFTLSMEDYQQSVMLQEKEQPFLRSDVTTVNATSLAKIMFEESNARTIDKVNEEAGSEFIYSSLLTDAMNSIIGENDKLDNLWVSFDKILGELVSFYAYQTFSGDVTYGYEEDTYFVSTRAKSSLAISELAWDSYVESETEETELSVEEVTPQDDIFDEVNETYLHSAQSLIEADTEFLSAAIDKLTFDGEYNYLEDQEKILCEIPLNNGDHSLVLIFPQDGTDLETITENIAQLSDWLGQAQLEQVSVTIPKLTIDSGYFDADLKNLTVGIDLKGIDSSKVEYGESESETNFSVLFDVSQTGVSGDLNISSYYSTTATVEHKHYNETYGSINLSIHGGDYGDYGDYEDYLVSVSIDLADDADYLFNVTLSYEYPFIYILKDNVNDLALISGRYNGFDTSKTYSLTGKEIKDNAAVFTIQ